MGRILGGGRSQSSNLKRNHPPNGFDLGSDLSDLADRHLTDGHLAEKHLAEKHLAEKHLAEEHLAEKHLAEKHLAEKHLAEERLAEERLAESLLDRKQIFIFLLIWALWLFQTTTGNFFTVVRILATVLGVLWAVWIANTFLLNNLLNKWLAVYPRRVGGLPGIVFFSFLHSNKDASHILGNSQGFLTWGTLVLLSGIDNFVLVTVLTGLASGLGLWLFERRFVRTVGASGVLFGYFGFLLARGYFTHDTLPALLSIASLFFYYFSLFNLFPTRPSVSWKGHMFGFLGGVATAYYLDGIKSVLAPGWLNNLGL